MTSRSLLRALFDLEMKSYTLVKRIAKHGRQNVIVIPSILQDKLNHGAIVQLKIDVLGKDEDKS